MAFHSTNEFCWIMSGEEIIERLNVVQDLINEGDIKNAQLRIYPFQDEHFPFSFCLVGSGHFPK